MTLFHLSHVNRKKKTECLILIITEATVMKVNNEMRDIFLKIKQSEHFKIKNQLLLSNNASDNNDLGNVLISYYHQTNSTQLQDLITQFMAHAGVVWTRKLLLNDTGKIASSDSKLASMSDYLSLTKRV